MQSLRLKRHVHKLQPDCLVSGRIGNELGDYGSLGDNQRPPGAVEGDWETPCTLNNTWAFNMHRPGEFRVIVEAVLNGDAKDQFGTHEVAVNVGRQSTQGKVGRKDMLEDRGDNDWRIVESDIGTITINKPGLCKLSLKALRLDKKASAGLTAAGVQLVP